MGFSLLSRLKSRSWEILEGKTLTQLFSGTVVCFLNSNVSRKAEKQASEKENR